jgi:hypothetical protein
MSVVLAVASVVLRLLAQVTVAVSTPAEAAVRDPVLVTVEVTAPAGRQVTLQPPSFAPFRLISASQVASSAAGALGAGGRRPAWQVTEWRYVLGAPDSARGRFDFEPFEARVTAPGVRPGGARSRRWGFVVRPSPATSRAAAVAALPRPGVRAGIAFHAGLAPETVYVGQQATYQIAVFLDADVRQRLRRNPEFLPPELRGMLAYDLPSGRSSERGRMIDGRSYDVHVFQRAVFPLVAGRVQVPPAQLTYALPLSTGFFSREESFTARSESTAVVAIEPPLAGRPAGWNGGVGVLRATARVDSPVVRVGDPLVLTLRVEGSGNVKLLPRPALALPWASAVAAEERVAIDSTALLVRGHKEFDWILTPERAGDHELAPIRYAYFDPYARRYAVATTEATTVAVRPGTLAARAADQERATTPLSIRPRIAAVTPPPLVTRLPFWVAALAVPVPALLALAHVRSAQRPHRAVAPVERLRRAVHEATGLGVARVRPARREGRGHEAEPATADARALRRAYVDALCERLRLSSDAFADAATLARRLRRCGVTAEAAAEAGRVLAALDRAAFARGLGMDADAAVRAPARMRCGRRSRAWTRRRAGAMRSCSAVEGGCWWAR